MNNFNLEVIGARCIVLLDKVENKTKSGIVLAQKVKEQPCTGTVLATGSGHITEQGIRIPMTIAVGDKVYFAKFAGTPITPSNAETENEYLVLNERDIIARELSDATTES